MPEQQPDDGSHQEHLQPQDDPHLGAEAAGVVRGLSRTSVRSLLRSPIGSLPKRRVAFKLPVQRVALVSDRIATGVDILSAASEATTTTASPEPATPTNSSNDTTRSSKSTTSKATRINTYRQRLSSFWTAGGVSRVGTVAGTIFKNTLLGTAVFESYCFAVQEMAAPNDSSPAPSITTITSTINTTTPGGNDNDEFARATLAMHWGAGWLAGTVHGVASLLLETTTSMFYRLHSPLNLRQVFFPIVNHALAHSCLFGSYESSKRLLTTQLQQSLTAANDDDIITASSARHDLLGYHRIMAVLLGLYTHQLVSFLVR